jgi:hypothetical protein
LLLAELLILFVGPLGGLLECPDR